MRSLLLRSRMTQRTFGRACRGLATSDSPQDLTANIRQDHRELERFYAKWKETRDVDEKKANEWFNQFIWEVSRHSVAEEQVVYPLLESTGEKGRLLGEKSREDHRELKPLLEKLRHETDNAKFAAEMDKMFANLTAHIKMEEAEDLPYIDAHVGATERAAASKAFEQKKAMAPTRPHPNVPDRPWMLENVLGMLMAPVDKLRDACTSFPERSEVEQQERAAASAAAPGGAGAGGAAGSAGAQHGAHPTSQSGAAGGLHGAQQTSQSGTAGGHSSAQSSGHFGGQGGQTGTH